MKKNIIEKNEFIPKPSALNIKSSAIEVVEYGADNVPREVLKELLPVIIKWQESRAARQ